MCAAQGAQAGLFRCDPLGVQGCVQRREPGRCADVDPAPAVVSAADPARVHGGAQQRRKPGSVAVGELGEERGMIGAQAGEGEARAALSVQVCAGVEVPEHLWNIGIRIEDDAVVTAKGCELITADVPKTIADIEALMRETPHV